MLPLGRTDFFQRSLQRNFSQIKTSSDKRMTAEEDMYGADIVSGHIRPGSRRFQPGLPERSGGGQRSFECPAKRIRPGKRP